jgi:hypothetical protein
VARGVRGIIFSENFRYSAISRNDGGILRLTTLD